MSSAVKINGCDLWLANQSGGKAGRGCNRTSSVQVHKDKQIIKIFRFTISDWGSRQAAWDKAKEFARNTGGTHVP